MWIQSDAQDRLILGAGPITGPIFSGPPLSDPVESCLAGDLRVRRFVPASLNSLVSSEPERAMRPGKMAFPCRRRGRTGDRKALPSPWLLPHTWSSHQRCRPGRCPGCARRHRPTTTGSASVRVLRPVRTARTPPRRWRRSSDLIRPPPPWCRWCCRISLRSGAGRTAVPNGGTGGWARHLSRAGGGRRSAAPPRSVRPAGRHRARRGA
jgi:hypothetical protein